MRSSTRSVGLRLPTLRGRPVRLLVLSAVLIGLVGARSQRMLPALYGYVAESSSSLIVASHLPDFTAVENADIEEDEGDPFPLPLEPQSPLGSLIYAGTVYAAIAGGDTDAFSIEVDPGHTISAIVRAAPTLQARIALSEAGELLADQAAAGPGEAVILPLVETADRLGDDEALPRSYALTVSGDHGSSGEYTLEVVLNALIEAEDHGGASNDEPAFAQDIEPSFLPLLRAVDANTSGAHPDRGAVRGVLGPDASVAAFEEDFESGDLGPDWFHFSSAAEGRVQVTGDFGTAEGGHALIMDRSPRGAQTVNQAIWTVDLTGIEDAVLVFRHADFRDEENPLPREFHGQGARRRRGDQR